MNGIILVGKASCNSTYACHRLSGNTIISTGSCLGPHSCSELHRGATIGSDSCLNMDACCGSEALIVQSNSCVGDTSCSFTKGLTKISSSSCIGVNACAGVTLGTISEESCQGVGACSRPDPTVTFPTLMPTSSALTYIFDHDGCDIDGDGGDINHATTSSTAPLAPFIVGSNSCNGCYAVSSRMHCNSPCTKFQFSYPLLYL